MAGGYEGAPASGKNGILINSYSLKSTTIKGISGFAIPPFDYS
jgi:hypothetical protein